MTIEHQEHVLIGIVLERERFVAVILFRSLQNINGIQNSQHDVFWIPEPMGCGFVECIREKIFKMKKNSPVVELRTVGGQITFLNIRLELLRDHLSICICPVMHAPIVAVFMKRYRVKEKILSGA